MPRLLRRPGRCEAMTFDSKGNVKHDRLEMEVRFHLLSHRYERNSVLVVSSLTLSHREHICHGPMATAAAIDQIAHHSVISGAEPTLVSSGILAASPGRQPRSAGCCPQIRNLNDVAQAVAGSW